MSKNNRLNTSRAATLVNRAVSKIGPLVLCDDNRFVSTDSAKNRQPSRPHSTPRHERHRVCQGETFPESWMSGFGMFGLSWK
jgi:hypothetical protein